MVSSVSEFQVGRQIQNRIKSVEKKLTQSPLHGNTQKMHLCNSCVLCRISELVNYTICIYMVELENELKTCNVL